MKISVSGAFSTGKTTLINFAVPLLDELGHAVTVIDEVARTVLADGYELDRGATIESYLYYVRLQLAAERAARHAELVLSDRSLIDLLAYVEVNNDPSIPPEFTELLREVVRHELHFFDFYCFLPVEFRPIADGAREVDPVYQRVVSEYLRDLLREFGAHTVEVGGPRDRRVQLLLGLVRQTVDARGRGHP